jgi:uncharacterized RDD family membrane protein YckC
LGGAPPNGPSPTQYASWGQRVGAAVINALPGFAISIVGFVLSQAISGLFLFLAVLAATAVALYIGYLDGEGQSPGKAVMGIRVLNEQTGTPLGGGMGIARNFLHVLDALPCYVGFLFPLWDAKRQTLCDKVLNTVVVPGPKAEFADAFKQLIPKKS